MENGLIMEDGTGQSGRAPAVQPPLPSYYVVRTFVRREGPPSLLWMHSELA